MFDATRRPVRPYALWGMIALALGALLAATSYFGNAVPLFFGRVSGLQLGGALVAFGAGLLVRHLLQGTA